MNRLLKSPRALFLQRQPLMPVQQIRKVPVLLKSAASSGSFALLKLIGCSAKLSKFELAGITASVLSTLAIVTFTTLYAIRRRKVRLLSLSPMPYFAGLGLFYSGTINSSFISFSRSRPSKPLNYTIQASYVTVLAEACSSPSSMCMGIDHVPEVICHVYGTVTTFCFTIHNVIYI